LNPVSTWKSEEEYEATAQLLAQKFIENFKEFADQASDEVRSAAPRVYSNAR
jgi:phosphoenolpyruvate carboxykinase (ATP)